MKKNLFSLLVLAGAFTLAFAFTACGSKGSSSIVGPGLSLPITFTVAFDANGATGSAPVSETVEMGETVELPPKGGLAKGSDIFGGWNTKKDGTGENYSAGYNYPVNKNLTFYANWLGVTEVCEVSFDENSGTGTPPDSITIAKNSFITLPGKGGLTNDTWPFFGGWAEDTHGDDGIFSEGSSYWVENDVTLYAIWKNAAAMCTVTFNMNGGGIGTIAPKTVSKGSTVTLPGVKGGPGKILEGWNTQADGLGTKYLVGQVIVVNDDLTLYAMWGGILLSKQGTVKFDANGGSGAVPAQQTELVGATITLPGKGGLSNGISTFDGWNTKADGTGVSYDEGDLFMVLAGTTTLYAEWKISLVILPKTRSVSFNANGANGVPPAAMAGLPGEKIILPDQGGLSTLYISIFTGWNTKDDGTGDQYIKGDEYTIGSTNTVLYAQWEKMKIPIWP